MILACLRQRRNGWLLAAGIAFLLLVGLTASASAQGPTDNETCLGCHANPGLSVELPSGEVLPLTVDPDVYYDSVHGRERQACVSCHTNIEGYPHPPLTAGDRRSFQLERYTQCQTCHGQQYNETLDSNHARALAAGNRQAAICTDCHGAHDVQPPSAPRQQISTTCQQCHSAIYEQYAGSVHGQVIQSGNPDLPTCTDCHGAHTQEDPTTTRFRLASPQLCAGCHANDALMRKYDISTDVMETYVADFHGTTVTLFEKQSPDQPTNKAVCTDCHGVHDIAEVSAANAMVVKENLLATCQRCHPDATANFPDSWVGHFRPSPDHNPLVYYVNLFYQFFVPAVLGGMGLFVLLDLGRRIINRFQRRGA